MGVLTMTNSVVQIIVDCNIKETKKNIIRFLFYIYTIIVKRRFTLSDCDG